MTIDTDKIKKPKKKNTTTIKEGPDGKLYTADGLLISGEGMARMSEKERQMIADILASDPQLALQAQKQTKRSIGPAGASTVSDDGKRMITRAKGGMVKKYSKGGEVKGYMNGGEVEVAMDDSPSSGMITQRGWGASRKT
jgi:hypothetical protein